MAGWTFNRQARHKRPADRRAAAQQVPQANDGDGSPDADAPLTLGAMLGVSSVAEPMGSSAQQAQLSRLVELEIIPRLMLMHRTQPLRPRLAALQEFVTAQGLGGGVRTGAVMFSWVAPDR